MSDDPSNGAADLSEPPKERSRHRVPLQNRMTRTEKSAVLALLTLLNEAEMPSFEVTTREDKGIDVLAHVVSPYFRPQYARGSESSWVREQVSNMVATARGLAPTDIDVTGGLLAFQVKGSKSFKKKDRMWRVSIEVPHQNFWDRTHLLVVLVAGDRKGRLRYLEASQLERRNGQKTVTANFEKVLDAKALQRLQRTHVVTAARRSAYRHVPDLFSYDVDAQHGALVACWSLADQPSVVRTLLHALPNLADETRADALMLVGSIDQLLDDFARGGALAELSEDELEAEVVKMDVEFGFGNVTGYDDKEWLAVVTSGFERSEIITISTAMVALGGGRLHAIPYDPWPDDLTNPGATDAHGVSMEMADVARSMVNKLPAVRPSEAMYSLLLRTENPTQLVIGLASDDLRRVAPNRTRDISWWVELVASVAYRHAEAYTAPARIEAFVVSRLFDLGVAAPEVLDSHTYEICLKRR